MPARISSEQTNSLIKSLTDGSILTLQLQTPDLMRSIMPKLGRVLGPRGLMPNAKAGTVTTDVTEAIQSIKAGQIEYRVERASGIVHVPIGKTSFEEESIKGNLNAVMSALAAARPLCRKREIHSECSNLSNDGSRYSDRPTTICINLRGYDTEIVFATK